MITILECVNSRNAARFQKEEIMWDEKCFFLYMKVKPFVKISYDQGGEGAALPQPPPYVYTPFFGT